MRAQHPVVSKNKKVREKKTQKNTGISNLKDPPGVKATIISANK